jgi:hypothetical protein
MKISGASFWGISQDNPWAGSPALQCFQLEPRNGPETKP